MSACEPAKVLLDNEILLLLVPNIALPSPPAVLSVKLELFTEQPYVHQLVKYIAPPFTVASLFANSESEIVTLKSVTAIAPPLPARFESHITFLIVIEAPLTSLTLIAPPLLSA